MNNNTLKGLVVLFILLIGLYSSAQNIDKIEKKLEKKFYKGKIVKVEKKAQKFKNKYPQLEAPNYFLSRVEIIKFNRVPQIPQKKQWTYLRKASAYAKPLSNEYQYWKDSLKTYYVQYIKSWNDNGFESEHVKKVVKAYSTYTQDTLLEYFKYYSNERKNETLNVHSFPVTDSLRSILIANASKLVGVPYKYAGETPETGFDCSGFVLYVFKSIGIELPHNAHMQSQLEGEIISLEEAKPGDLIFFGNKNEKGWHTQHAGIVYEYQPNEPKVIHCVSRGVSIDGNNSSWDNYWKERILFVKRLPQFE